MRFTFVALALLAACTSPKPPQEAAQEAVQAPEVTDAEQLVRAMHDRYVDSWYGTVTFTQATIRHGAAGTADTTIWHEAMRSPGRLRIDIGSLDDGNGLLFAAGTLFNIQDGKVTRRQPLLHPLLILGFDVYAQPVDTTLAQLGALGYDLSVMHEDRWQDRPVWVVGAPAGDTTGVQFWVDQERLLTVRTIRHVGAAGQSVQDVRFDDYAPLGAAWISPMMRFYIDGRLDTEEVYTDIKRDTQLPDSLFDPTSWQISVPYWE